MPCNTSIHARYRSFFLIVALLLHACGRGGDEHAAGVRSAQLGAAFVAYHGATAAEHQAHVDELSAKGYRPVSLNVSGAPSDARYAAVWVAKSGPAWAALHGLSGADYQARFDELVGQGYAPTIVSATGPAGRERYAAVFERGVSGAWYARHGIRWGTDSDPDSLVYENNRAFSQGYIPVSLAMYGDPSDRRFAGVWVQNSAHVAWSWWLTANASSYQHHFDALVAGGLRPSVLSVAADGAVLSVFRDDQIGAWTAKHNLTAAQYQAAFDAQLAQGQRPILISAGGAGADARYASVFSEDDVPVRRVWNVSGEGLVGGGFAGATELDDALQQFMRAHSIRAASVAVGRAGNVVAARGYTWAEASYPTTAPDTRFRLASLSKLFAAAESSKLVDAGQLSWSTPAFGFVGVTSSLPAGTTPDPAAAAITVEQLLLRTSHLVRNVDDARTLAPVLGTSAVPIPRADLLRVLYGMPLVGAIPAGGFYSNAAFYLLTSVIEQASGMSLVAALNRDVLTALGISDVSVGATAAAARLPGEVATYDAASVGASQLDYASDAVAPAAYGGQFVLENSAGAGGLIASAPSIVKVIAHYPVWNRDHDHLYGRELATRYGAFDGTGTGASSRADGLDVAFLFNRRVEDADKDALLAQIHGILDRYASAL